MTNFVPYLLRRSLKLTLGILFLLPTALFAQNDNSDEPRRRTDHPNAYYNQGGRLPRFNNGMRNPNRKPENEYPVPKGIVSVSPFAFATSHLMLGYEIALSNKTGLRTNFAMGSAQNSEFYNLENMKGYQGDVQLRFYPLSNALRGVFFGAFFLVKNIEGEYSYWQYSAGRDIKINRSVNATASQFGVLIGYQGTFSGLVAYDFYGGGGILNSNYKADEDNPYGRNDRFLANQTVDSFSTGMQLRLGFSIGFVTHTKAVEPPARR